jgi:DNA-binding GntR family transcriptional regulator
MTERDGLKVARHLRESILRLDLRPGQTLDEADLSERLGVSRTPVREAIIQLVADGLVVRDGRKARVAPLDFDEMPALFDALLLSSRIAQRLAAERRSAQDLELIAGPLEAFEQAVAANSSVARSEANVAFHRAIAKAARNKYVEHFYGHALVDAMRLSRACFAGAVPGDSAADQQLAAHLAETERQHRQILAAIEQRDPVRADALAVAHHELTRRRVMAVLSKGSASADMPLRTG